MDNPARPTNFLHAISGRLLDLALPATCAGCGREGQAVCPGCEPRLDARLHLPPGVQLGLPGEVPATLLQLEWCAPFGGLMRTALHQLKYAGERRVAVPLGAAIARRWARAGAGGDLLVPVPVHPARVRQRGFDQAELLATAAAERLRTPWAPLLARTRNTVAQYHLGRGERAANVADAFALAAGIQPSTVAGRWIVLVDDVVTTGATLTACAAPLLAAGALGVSAVTAARER